jgi:hypothetical protein
VGRERNCGGDLDVLSFVRISLWNWIDRVNRMDSNRRLSQEFNKNPQRSRIRGWSKNRWWNCVEQILADAKLQIGKRGKKQTEMIRRSTLRRRRSALDCSAIWGRG